MKNSAIIRSIVLLFNGFAIATLISSCGEQLSAPNNNPPQLNAIPGQIIAPGETFDPISLDDYVVDESDDADIAWTVSDLEHFDITIQDRIVQLSPADSSWRGTSSVTFTATDPEGLSSFTSATFGVIDPQETEIVDADGRVNIVWQTLEAGDSRVLYWPHQSDPACVASTRDEFGTMHNVHLLELESNQWYDYFAFCLDASGDTIYKSPSDSFITDTIQPAQLLKAHFIDVKQGDACFIETAGRTNILVDGGYGTIDPYSDPWDGDGVPYALNYLQSLGVTGIDLMIKTHDHADHYGGLLDIMDSNIQVSEAQAPFPGWGFMATLYAGETLSPDDLTEIKILNSGYPAGVSQSGENNSSIVLRLSYGDFSLLLTGDAENPVNSYLIANFASDLPATVLKVNHHGSSDATTSEWLDFVSPFVAVISCGEGNPYGHPHQSTLAELAAHNAEILRTDQNGDITVVSDGTKSWVWIYSL